MPGKGGGIPGQLYGGAPYDCATCNQVHPRGCRAHRKHLVPLTPCMQMPVTGATVCRVHGGNAKQVKAAGVEAAFQAKAAKLAGNRDRAIIDPFAELMAVAGEVVAFKDAVGELVNGLQDRIRFTSDPGAEQLRSEIAVYERALDRATKTLTDIIRLGIEDRVAKVGELQVRAIAAFMDAVLTDLGHNPRDPQIAGVVVRRLKAIA